MTDEKEGGIRWSGGVGMSDHKHTAEPIKRLAREVADAKARADRGAMQVGLGSVKISLPDSEYIIQYVQRLESSIAAHAKACAGAGVGSQAPPQSVDGAAEGVGQASGDVARTAGE